MLEYLACLCLLLSPADPALTGDPGPAMWLAWMQVNADCDVYSGNSWFTFPEDVRWAREQHQRARCWPPSWAAMVLPEEEECHQCRIVAAQHVEICEIRAEGHPRNPYFQAALERARMVQSVWDAAHRARYQYAGGARHDVRECLGLIQQAIGKEAFWMGQLPPPIP